jgi:hypothetical protein
VLVSDNLVARIIKSILDGSIPYAEASKGVNEAIDIYSASIMDLSASLGIQLLLQGEGLHEQVSVLSERVDAGFRNVEGSLRTIVGIDSQIQRAC